MSFFYKYEPSYEGYESEVSQGDCAKYNAEFSSRVNPVEWESLLLSTDGSFLTLVGSGRRSLWL